MDNCIQTLLSMKDKESLDTPSICLAVSEMMDALEENERKTIDSSIQFMDSD